MSPTAEPRVQPAVALRLVRLAMVVGTLGFGAVVWVLFRQNVMHPELTAPRARLYRDLAIAAWVAGSIGLGTVLLLRQRLTDELRDPTYAVIGWAIGEAVAIVGGVFYLLTDLAQFYVLGLIFFGAALLMVPVRRA